MESGSGLIEIKENVFYVPGKNKSRFPYCSCLYLKGKKCRVLLDAGMGAEAAGEIRNLGIDLVVLSHCHVDHRLSLRHFGRPDVYCHEKEAEYLPDKQRFLSATGFDQCGLDIDKIFRPDLDLSVPVSGTLADGQTLDLGGMTLEIIHAHRPYSRALGFPYTRTQVVVFGGYRLEWFWPLLRPLLRKYRRLPGLH